MTATAQVSKWGNSLGVRIPKALAKTDGLKDGDIVEIDIRRVNALPTSLYEFLQEKHWDGKQEKEEEIDWGKNEGEEVW